MQFLDGGQIKSHADIGHLLFGYVDDRSTMYLIPAMINVLSIFFNTSQ